MTEQSSIPYASAASPQSVDAGHLKAIVICHYVWGVLELVLSCIFIAYIAMGMMIVHGTFPKSPGPNQTPPQMGYIFVFMGVFIMLLGWTVGVLTIVSGRAIARRKWRVFSLVIAGVNCASFPLGTLLGVFTFIVLLRESVRATYP